MLRDQVAVRRRAPPRLRPDRTDQASLAELIRLGPERLRMHQLITPGSALRGPAQRVGHGDDRIALLLQGADLGVQPDESAQPPWTNTTVGFDDLGGWMGWTA